MKTPRIKASGFVDMGSLINVLMFRIGNLNPYLLIASGALVLVLVVVLFLTSAPSQEENDEALARAQQVISQVSGVVQNMRQVLEEQKVQELAVLAVDQPGKLFDLQHYVRSQIPELIEIELFPEDLSSLRAPDLGPFGYAVLDMLLVTSESGLAPAQMHGEGTESYMAIAVRVGEQADPSGYLVAKVDPDSLVSAFQAALSSPGSFALEQFHGELQPTTLSDLSKKPSSLERIVWLRIPTSLFRVGFIQGIETASSGENLRPPLFILGTLLTVLGVMLKFRPSQAPLELQEDPVRDQSVMEEVEPGNDQETVDSLSHELSTVDHPPGDGLQDGVDPGDGLGVIDLPDLGFNLEKGNVQRKKVLPPVELVESIFRAYDIRGIVGETLDAEVAYQVGQVVGTLTLEQDAEPAVVGRDGRDSGVDLIEGLINGMASTGCDVVDIGAVPTGVLYFAAYELGSATGVMVTGSHNPPDYNGIKMVIGGVTQSGDQITDIYKRIKSGSVRVGKGKVSQQEMLGRFRERISSDIQLERPL